MATLIVLSTARHDGEDALISYVEQVIPMIIDAGGTPIKRLHVSDVVCGNANVEFVFVADFEDASTIRRLFDSAEYQALLPVRDRGFEAIDIYITEDN